MKLILSLLAFIVAGTAFAVPGVKRHNLGTIRPTNPAVASPGIAESLGDHYSLVGTISCDACASPFQPVAVVRDLSTQKLLHLRVGDELALVTGEHAVVTTIGSGDVEFKSARGSYKLRAGGFPDESSDNDGSMMAKTPPSYLPAPAGSVRW